MDTSGTLTDTQSNRQVWNYYNRLHRSCFKVQSSTWAGATGWRAFNNNTANKITVTRGLLDGHDRLGSVRARRAGHDAHAAAVDERPRR